MMDSLVEAVLYNSKAIPDKIAIVTHGRKISYSELGERISRAALHLKALGVKSGDAVAIRTSQDEHFVECYLAIHLAGGTAVPLDSDFTEETLSKVSEKTSLRHMINDCGPFVEESAADSGLLSLPCFCTAADILFTTGTTGQSKGVMISHRAWMADADNLIDAQGFSSGLMFITTGPLNHIGNLSKIYPTLICGGTLNILEGMKNMEDFFAALDCMPEKKKAAFLVPASIRMLVHLGAERLGTYSDIIDFIETGAAPISQNDMRELSDILPHSRLFNTYASTETGIICTYQFNDGKQIPSCTGPAMKNSEVEIIDGHIVCKGATLMSGYAGDPEATDKIMHDGMLFTQDLGYISDEGYLILEGRDGDVINVGGFKISPVEVENVALENEAIRECICISAQHPVLGNVLKLLVVPEEGHSFSKKETALYMKSRLEGYKVPFYYEEVQSIKRTFNGKPDRKAYR